MYLVLAYRDTISVQYKLTDDSTLKTENTHSLMCSRINIYVMFTVQYSLHVKRVRLLFNSPRKSHSYTCHVKWGSEGREGGCRVEGNQEGHSYSIIVSYEVMLELELEHSDHTFTS